MRAVAIAALLGVLGDSAAAFQCTLSPSMVASPPAVSRRHAIGACAFGALSMFPTLANADAEKPLVPESEMIKPPANSCAQGVGGKCTELAEGNPLILELQKKSAQNRQTFSKKKIPRLKYQRQELESYWNRNYKEFFDSACTAKDTKCGFEQTADGKWRVTDKKPQGVALKAFKDRGVDVAGASAAKGAGIPDAFK